MTAKYSRMSAGDRRTAILDVAVDLLSTHPWEEVTVALLLEAAGISKGGFYHHFASKDEVLAALLLRFTDASTAAGQAVYERSPGGAAARFTAYLAGTTRWELDHADKILAVIRIAMMAGNESIFLKLEQESRQRATPLLRRLVADGVREGAFDVIDTDMTVSLLQHAWRMRWVVLAQARQCCAEGDRAGGLAMLEDRLDLEERMTNRLLGCGAGTAVRMPEAEAFMGFLLSA
ncbi:TetR/AcrR family transcriptional regulator [Salipiger pacificus]|nr:TetR/AcrR family transcriptional regulator [Alloyangia pacifica]MCA0946868.1 TetR/AcrR family transcriptional regulator [Alloyangia pacifica]